MQAIFQNFLIFPGKMDRMTLVTGAGVLPKRLLRTLRHKEKYSEKYFEIS